MRKKSKKNKDLIGYIIIFAVALTIISIGYFVLINEKANIDPDTLCQRSTDLNTHVIVIDISDTYNSIQVIQIKKILNDIIENLSKGERVEVYTINGSVTAELEAKISLCNPGKGEKKNKYISNPELMKKRWNKKFYEPMSKVLNQIDVHNQSKTSPILEVLQVVNNKAFPLIKREDKTYTITIISDMIQNSSNLSFYKNNSLTINTFFKSKGYKRVRTDLSKTSINIFVARRDNNEYLQTRQYMDFWIDLFQSFDAKIGLIKGIDG